MDGDETGRCGEEKEEGTCAENLRQMILAKDFKSSVRLIPV